MPELPLTESPEKLAHAGALFPGSHKETAGSHLDRTAHQNTKGKAQKHNADADSQEHQAKTHSSHSRKEIFRLVTTSGNHLGCTVHKALSAALNLIVIDFPGILHIGAAAGKTSREDAGDQCHNDC